MSMRTGHLVVPGVARQRGLSLIELMIGMVLGLIVISAVFNMYVGSTRSSQFSEGLQSMQENGRFGIGVLRRGFRLAGYSPGMPVAPLKIASSGVDTVVVQQLREYDCNGEKTTTSSGIAVNTYAFDAGRNEITCTGNSANARAMPIVEDVDGFRVLYGLDTDNDKVPERFVGWSADINPGQVSALRIALLVNSGKPIRSRNVSESHVLFDQEIDTEDRYARYVFTSTIKLRNRR